MRKSFFIISFLFVASVVRAEVLSWSVDLAIGNEAYATAQLFSSTSGDSGYWNSETHIGNAIYKSEDGYVVQYDSNVTPGTEYFFVKLFNSSGTFLSYSDAKSWSTLVADQNLVSGSAPEMSALNPWNITATTTVPEPTAMALLAMGVSALLLRRKRVA
jgi:hypothetical protein